MFKRFLAGSLLILGIGMFLPGCRGGPMGFPIGGPMGFPMGGPGGPPPDMHGKRPEAEMLERLDKTVKSLNLTEEQKVKFDLLKSKLQEKHKHMERDCKENNKFDFMTELKKDNPDVNMMAGKFKEDIDMMSTKCKEDIDRQANDTKETLDLFTAFYNTLDENQKKILIDKAHKKINAMEILQED
jgi:hypothetical protein